MSTLLGGSRRTEAAGDGDWAIECSGVSVRFGDLLALDDVSLSWAPGTINAVVGQNGAGKTTLARVLGGLQTPSSGSLRVGGEPMQTGHVHEARRRGVELVHQHFALPATFTVAQALELFSPKHRRAGVFSKRRMLADARAELDAGGLEISPGKLVGDLPVETLQALEITRALASQPRVLVLDEPTAVLSPPAVESLFTRVRKLADDGICVILVLHKLAEVRAVADTISVLRGGKLVLPPTQASDIEQRDLSRTVIGDAEIRPAQVDEASPPGFGPVVRPGPNPRSAAQPRLELAGLAAATPGHDAPLRGVDLSVLPGEIVGVAGVEGNGQRSLVEAVIGVTRTGEGHLRLDGSDVTAMSVQARRRLGIRTIPFERNTEGVSRTSALWENHALLGRCDPTRRFLPSKEKEACRRELDRWNVRYRDVAQRSGELSGGNVQKTILARELSGEVRCLVAAHPTRGLDIAATAAVREALVAVADSGASVLLVSADLDELFELSHRLVVLCAGRIVEVFEPPYELHDVGWAMTGGGT